MSETEETATSTPESTWASLFNYQLDTGTITSTGGTLPSTRIWTTWDSSSANTTAQVARHRTLLVSAGFKAVPEAPMGYFSVVSQPAISIGGSTARDAIAAAEVYYDQIDRTLGELEQLADTPDSVVEKGAVMTAKEVVRQIRADYFAPPEITWQDGEAVIMLWAFGSRTCAVTITDGEVGYVVRSKRKQIALRHSISIRDFRLIEQG